MKRLVVLAFAAVALWACSDDDKSVPVLSDSTPVYQNLQVEYNGDKKQTNVSANFLKNNMSGQNVQLAPPSSIMFNGQSPTSSSDSPYLYTATFSGHENVVFTLTRKPGEVYTNTVTVDEYAFPEIVGVSSISLKSGTFFVWMGKAVGEGETVEVRIKTSSDEYKFQANEVGNIGVDIKFPATAKPGQAQLYVSRIQTPDIQQDDKGAGGQITVLYTNEQEITLE